MKKTTDLMAFVDSLDREQMHDLYKLLRQRMTSPAASGFREGDKVRITYNRPGLEGIWEIDHVNRKSFGLVRPTDGRKVRCHCCLLMKVEG